MVSPSAKRRAVKQVVETGLGTTAEACRALGLARSSYYCNSIMSPESRMFQRQIVDLSQEHPRYGYRRVRALLRREDHEVNAKRVQRVRRVEGLQVTSFYHPVSTDELSIVNDFLKCFKREPIG